MRPAYDYKAALDVSGARVWQLHRWERIGFAAPRWRHKGHRRYSADDIAWLYMVVSLSRALSVSRIRRDLSHLRLQIGPGQWWVFYLQEFQRIQKTVPVFPLPPGQWAISTQQAYSLLELITPAHYVEG